MRTRPSTGILLPRKKGMMAVRRRGTEAPSAIEVEETKGCNEGMEQVVKEKKPN
jgi:hypothetical protein